ncbi:MAG: Tab2 family RNA-binding protein [Pleurocapsa sp.]
MKIWQVDFYYFPVEPKQWELVICTDDVKLIYLANCPNSQANSEWLERQFVAASEGQLPDLIQVFRPQALGLITIAANQLKIAVEATRHTPALKNLVVQRAKENAHNNRFPNYNPLAIDRPPPQPLPENLWGEEWQIANIAAGEIVELFCDRPLPIKNIPEAFDPLNLGIASNVPIPGIVVYGGRNSLVLARWIEQQKPVFLKYIPTEVERSGGLILETGLVDRWIFNTFESQDVARIAADYEDKKQQSKNLHFLLIQPDRSGMTYTGFWLLKEVD